MNIYEMFEYPSAILSVQPSEIVIEASGKYEGSFYAENIGGYHLMGMVSVKDEKYINIIDKEFSENKSRIRFSVDLSELKGEEVINTYVTVTSNGGEIILPATIKSMPDLLEVIGDFRIASLKEFYECAKIHKREAEDLFYSNKFRLWLKQLQYKYIDVYDIITKDKNAERALKNFFVLNKFENPSALQLFNKNVQNLRVSQRSYGLPFTAEISKTEFINNEEGFFLITNKDINEITVSAKSDLEMIKFEKQDVSVRSQTKLSFSVKVGAIQAAQLRIRRLPFFKDRICISFNSKRGIVEEYFDVTVGEVSFKGQEEQIAAGHKMLLDYRLTGGFEHLKKAMAIAGRFVNSRRLSVPALLFAVLVCIEADDVESARSILNNIERHKSYYRFNNIEVFGEIMFLSALCDLRKRKPLERSRELKVLEECEAEHDFSVLPLFLGILEFERLNLNKAGEYFKKCYEKGCRSSYFFGYLYRFFQKEVKPGMEEVLDWFINRVLSENIDLSSFIMRNKKVLNEQIFFDRGTIHKLYDKYKQSFLLEIICNSHIKKGDFSKGEYEYYKKAEQTKIDGICGAIVKAAKNTDDENISRYTISRFLKEPQDDDSVAFVYHLIISGKKYSDLLASNKLDIVEFGKNAIKLSNKGRHYNSLYKYMLDVSNDDDSIKAYADELERVLFDSLFGKLIEFENTSVTHMWVYESECVNTKVYAVTGGQTRIKTNNLNDDFEYVCYDIKTALIVDANMKKRNTIENADFKLCLHLYKKGYCSDELMIFLSSRIINGGGYADCAVDILNQTVSIKNISDEFKMQVCAKIASIMCEIGNYEKAYESSKGIRDHYLKDQHLACMIDAFIDSRSFDKLCELINQRSKIISDDLMIKVIDQIVEDGVFAPQVASFAFALLMRGCYSPFVLDAVIKHYKGGNVEYEQLFIKLLNSNIMSAEIAEIVIRNNSYCPPLNETAQKAFVNLYETSHNHQNEYIEIFTYFLIYEIIVNGTKLKAYTIEVLEKIYEESSDRLLAYALCTFYLENRARSSKSVKIINDASDFMEADGIVIPIIKKWNNLEVQIAPYIQKKQPFFYKTRPGASVFLYYKLDNDVEFKVKPMKYFRFGIYLASVTMFYNEKITYCISEEMRSGSILTKEEIFVNRSISSSENSGKFSEINSGLMYLEKSRYDRAESAIERYLRPPKNVVGRMI